MQRSHLKNIKLRQIPIINLRLEVSNYMGLFNNDEFCSQFNRVRKKNDSINTIYESWYGRSELLLTQILRQSILNIESAVCSCVYFLSAFKGMQNERIIEAVKNPFTLGGRSTAINVYDRLPALIDENFKLSIMNYELWLETKDFYQEIRNPLFHGKELTENNPKNVQFILEFILKLFKWLDTWFDLNELIENASSLSDIPEFENFINQIVIPDYIPQRKNKSTDKLIETPVISDISGIWVQKYVQITTVTDMDKSMNLYLSPKAAMKLLGYLALAQKNRGWRIPERL